MEEEKPPLKRTKRLTSAVWNDFDRVRKGDMMVAICKHCDKKLSGSSTSGTSHLRNHLKRCLKRSDEDIAQQRLVVREKKGTVDLKSIKFEEDEHSRFRSRFDQDQSQDDLTRMIILHGYPLSMVEHIGFRRFVSNLQPLFQIMSSDSARASCVELYEKEKQKVYDALHKLPGRISLTAEVWTSFQETRSLCLTAYYIDEAWQLQRKMLNFVYVESDTEQAFSEALMTCLMKWGIDRKLFSITVDNCSNNDNAIFKVRDRLSEEKSILSNVELFHVRCATRILNVIVEDVLEALQDVTHKIRESIRYVSSESVKEKFSEVSQQVSEKTLSIDIPDQWTSTYEMLESAIQFREAFTRLQASDTSYLTSPSDIEWERTISLTNYLKLVVEVTTVISGAKYSTANIYFPEICDIHLKLIEWCKSSDTSISSMALKMKEKFDSYWSVSGLSLTLAVVLDPRFKMKLVEYYFKQMFEDTATESIKKISVTIQELFHEYSTPPSSGDNKTLTDNGNNSVLESETNDRLSGFDKFLHDTSSSPRMKSELDKYLEEPIFPRNADFDILNWWKVSSPKYPVLSVMARDILGSSMSIADNMASAFAVGGRVLDLQRSSLSPDILEALVCTHDWLRTEFESELVVTDSIRPLTITAN